MVASGNTEALRQALIDLVAAVGNMRVPQNVADAALQVSVTMGPALERARYALKTAPLTIAPEIVADMDKEIGELRAEVLRLEARIESAQKDAARYRWLRERKARNNRWPHITQHPRAVIDTERVPQIWEFITYYPERLDEAIDMEISRAPLPRTDKPLPRCPQTSEHAMSSILELAARCERGTDPDRELDLAIQQAITGKPWRWANEAVFEPGTVITWDKYGPGAAGNPYFELERFTESLDAAVALIPEEFSSEFMRSDAPADREDMKFTRCRLWDWRRGPIAIDPANEWRAEGNRPLPLNICAAALKVRASLALSSNKLGGDK